MKKLYRSKQDRMISGVCGGIAEYYDMDPVWIRLIAILLALFQGVGVIVYIVAWILIPENPNQKAKTSKIGKDSKEMTSIKTASKVASKTVSNTQNVKDRAPIVGIIFIIIGALFLINNLFDISSKILIPSAIILVGILLLIKRSRKE